MSQKKQESAFPSTPVRIVWAVDAFHLKPKAQLRTLDAIHRLYGDEAVSIQPVSMLPIGKFDPASQHFLDRWNELEARGRENVEKLMKSAKFPGLLPPILVRVETDSVAVAARCLLQVAVKEKADVIGVSSHARHGVARVLLGSFAETITMESPIPILVVNPKNGPGLGIKTIVFPTDFSDASHQVFQKIVKLAAPLKARIQLFHKIPYPYPTLTFPLVVMPMPEDDTPKRVRERLTATAQPWIGLAEKHGVQTKLTIDVKPGYPLDSILDLVKGYAPGVAIAMASQSGKIAAALTGSLTRQVLRSAPCPILVVHPDQEKLRLRLVESAKELAYAASAHPVLT